MGCTSAIFSFLRRAKQLKWGQCCIGFHSSWPLISWIIMSHKDTWLGVNRCGPSHNTAQNGVLREAHILITHKCSFYLAGLCVLDPTAVPFCGSQEVKCATTSASSSLLSLFFLWTLCKLLDILAVSDLAKGCWFIHLDSCAGLCHGQVQLLFFSKPQIALACREHCTRSRALISHGPYIPSLTVKEKHIWCSWERKASTDELLLVSVFPNKSGMCYAWNDWHMMCVPRFHYNKYQCPSVNSRSVFPIHP